MMLVILTIINIKILPIFRKASIWAMRYVLELFVAPYGSVKNLWNFVSNFSIPNA